MASALGKTAFNWSRVMKKGIFATSRQNLVETGPIGIKLGTVARGRTNTTKGYKQGETKAQMKTCTRWWYFGFKSCKPAFRPSYVKDSRTSKALEQSSSVENVSRAFFRPSRVDKVTFFGVTGRDFLKCTYLAFADKPLRRMLLVSPRSSLFDFGEAPSSPPMFAIDLSLEMSSKVSRKFRWKKLTKTDETA